MSSFHVPVSIGAGGTGAQGATGPAGAQGATGPVGPGATQFLSNNGVSLGAFSSINLQGGLVGVTGPNAGTISISSLNDFIQLGVTGLGASGSCYIASGAMVSWNTEQAKQGAIGHTTIPSASAWVVVQKSAYYQVITKLNFTGAASGTTIQAQQLLNATGMGAGASGFAATPISQSVAYLQLSGPSGYGITNGTIEQDYIVYIPSGSNIETYVNYSAGGGGSPIVLAPTGTMFTMKTV